MNDDLLTYCNAVIEELYERCRQNEPNYGVQPECFATSMRSTLKRYAASCTGELSPAQAETFLRQIQLE
ncbi:MAG: hypothetical protein C4325_04175, partial [Blastocatellia bacterium]